jgi:hypothetical protein
MATTTAKLFGQSRPSDTNFATVYSRPASTESIVKQVTISNSTAGAATFRLCVDNDGNTYDESNNLYWDVTIDPNTSLNIGPKDCFIAMNTANGTIGFRSSVASALTCSIYGIETA